MGSSLAAKTRYRNLGPPPSTPGGGGTWGSITGDINDQADLQAALAAVGGGTAVTSSVSQTAHGFAVGTPVKLTSAGWVAADADAETTMCDAMVSAIVAATTTYATLNSADKSANITLSGGDLIATRGAAAAGWASVRSTLPLIGKVYLEVTSNFAAATDGMATGIGLSSVSLATYPGGAANSNSVIKGLNGFGQASAYSNGGGSVNYAQNACGIGDVAQLAIDVPAGKGWYRQAGSANWHGGGDPATGTTPTFTFTPAAAMYFMLALYQNGNSATVNFGASPFTYAVPSGFSAGLFTTTSNDFTATEIGQVTLTTAEWDARTGDTGGLTKGEYYWLSTTAGFITKTQPTSGFAQCLGVAESATVLRFAKGPVVALAGGAGSGAYMLAGVGQTAVGVWDFAVDGAKTNVDFTGLAGFSEILIMGVNVTKSVSGVPAVVVSVDNGASFYNTSGDYINTATTGVAANAPFAALHGTNATAARTGAVRIVGANVLAGARMIEQINNPTEVRFFLASSSAINAVRIYGSAGGTLNGGKIYVFAR